MQNGLGEQRGHHVANLLLLESYGAGKAEGIWYSLYPGGFADRQASVLGWVDEHVLAEIADHDGGVVGMQSAVDSGMALGNVIVRTKQRR